MPFYTAFQENSLDKDHSDFTDLEDSPEIERLREGFERELLGPPNRPGEEKPLLTSLLSGPSGVFTITLPSSDPCLLAFSTPFRASDYARIRARTLQLKYLSATPRQFVQMVTDLKRHSAVQSFALDVCPYCLIFPVCTTNAQLTPADVVKIWAVHKSGELARESLYFVSAKDAADRGDLQKAKATALHAIQHVTAESPRLHFLLGKIAIPLGEQDMFREAQAFLEFLHADQLVRELLAAKKSSEIQN